MRLSVDGSPGQVRSLGAGRWRINPDTIISQGDLEGILVPLFRKRRKISSFSVFVLTGTFPETFVVIGGHWFFPIEKEGRDVLGPLGEDPSAFVLRETGICVK